jgi:tRNA(Ile)-lysidine synthase
MELLDRVRQTIRRHDLAPRGTRVVVALSGGSDSVALAHLLMQLDAAGELTVACIGHFNHQLRASADADERFCAEVAASLGRPFAAGRGDVAGLARREQRSIEDAARLARYDFLERARVDGSADVVALGHTRDDQAETFLLRLLRGAGARGLAGMHPRRGLMIRPLLDCRRGDLIQYLRQRGLAFVHDASNEDVGVPRNRVRAELLPLLVDRFNPSVVDVLADEAELAREEWLWMEALAGDAFGRIVQSLADESRIDCAALTILPVALARLVVRRALIARAAGRPISFSHVESTLALAREGGPPIDLPGQRLERIGSFVVLRSRPSRRSRSNRATLESPENLFSYPLSIPGEVLIPRAGLVVSADLAASPGAASAKAGSGAAAATALVQFDRSAGPLTVRNRRPGDRFRPLGLGGRKKLQDFFVDRKVARPARDEVPLVVDEFDRIVWVAGHAIDDRFRVRDPAQAVVILKLTQVSPARKI